MLKAIPESLGQTLLDLLEPLAAFLWANLFSLLGFVLALLIIGRMLNEKRQPSNIFAWSLLVLVFPVVGVPLYFLVGGRKSRWLVKKKQAIQRLALKAANDARPHEQAHQTLSNKFEGNDFTLLGNGMETFEALCREIENAERSIHIMTYILGKDETGRRVRDLLAKKAAAGIEVRLLIDAFGSFFTRGRFLQSIQAAGGEAVRFIPVLPLQTHTSANLRNHRKIAVIDNERAIVGGQNIEKRFMGAKSDPNRFLDFSVLVQGPIVATLNRIFLTDWAYAAKTSPHDFREIFAHRPDPCGESAMEVIASGPDVEGDLLWDRIITLVQECRRKVTIVTPYFIPDEVLFRSLMVKAHMGKRIRIILPEKSNHTLADLARNHYLRQLHDSGAEILLHPGKMIHGKIMLVDNTCALIGSANIDMRSLFVNFEIGLLITTPADIALLHSWVERLLDKCKRFEEYPIARFGNTRRMSEQFAKLLVPLL